MEGSKRLGRRRHTEDLKKRVLAARAEPVDGAGGVGEWPQRQSRAQVAAPAYESRSHGRW